VLDAASDIGVWFDPLDARETALYLSGMSNESIEQKEGQARNFLNRTALPNVTRRAFQRRNALPDFLDAPNRV